MKGAEPHRQPRFSSRDTCGILCRTIMRLWPAQLSLRRRQEPRQATPPGTPEGRDAPPFRCRRADSQPVAHRCRRVSDHYARRPPQTSRRPPTHGSDCAGPDPVAGLCSVVGLLPVPDPQPSPRSNLRFTELRALRAGLVAEARVILKDWETCGPFPSSRRVQMVVSVRAEFMLEGQNHK
jgi:hypothetical protein